MTAANRTQIASLVTCYVVAGLFWGSFAAAMPALQARTGLDAGGFGLALGVMSLAAFPVMRVIGARLHRIETWAIPGCMGVFAFGALVMGLAPSLPLVIAAFVITGGASGALDIALNNRTARVEAATGASLFNRTHAAFPAAMLAGSAATGALRGQGVPLIVIFGAIALAFTTMAVIERRAGAQAGNPDAHAHGTAKPRAALVGAVLILALIAALGAFQEASSLAWAAIFVESVRGAGPAIAGLAPAAFTLGLSAGRLSAHALEHRLRPATTVRLAAALAIPAFLAIAADLPMALTILAFFAAGMGVGPIEPAVFRAVATRADGPDRGPTLAAVTAVAYLGYLLSPPALGGVATAFGWPALWAATAILAALVFALSTRLPARHP